MLLSAFFVSVVQVYGNLPLEPLDFLVPKVYCSVNQSEKGESIVCLFLVCVCVCVPLFCILSPPISSEDFHDLDKSFLT